MGTIILVGLVLFLLLILSALCFYIKWQLEWPNILKGIALTLGKSGAKDVSHLLRLLVEEKALSIAERKRQLDR